MFFLFFGAFRFVSIVSKSVTDHVEEDDDEQVDAGRSHRGDETGVLEDEAGAGGHQRGVVS